MKIQDTFQEACIGTTVHFSNADLIVLKEAFQPIQDHLGSEECIRTEAEGIKPTLTSVPMENIFMIQVFIEHLTKGVRNLDEVRDTLFSRDLDTKTGLIPEGLVQARDSESHINMNTRYHLIDKETGIEDGSTILSKQEIMDRLSLISQEFEDVVSGNLSLNGWAIKKV